MRSVTVLDGSYYVFYRYHALRVWWGKARGDDEPKDPGESPRFIAKFKSTFYDKLKALEKRHGHTGAPRWVAKDCPRREIWRNEHLPAYKGTRQSRPEIGIFMELAYRELFVAPHVAGVMERPTLEADDCAAITLQRMHRHQPEASVLMVTGDMDYLQLARPGVILSDLRGRLLTDNKNSLGDATKDLAYKIIRGDKSDNIAPVFKRCGDKACRRYIEDPECLRAALDKDPMARAAFERNRVLIDFEKIPNELVAEFSRAYQHIWS